LPTVKGKLIRSRTVITNFKDIAQKFSREDDHLTKYFLREAGVRGELDARGNLTLHSRFQPAGLNNIVSRYFDNIVEAQIQLLRKKVQCLYVKLVDIKRKNLNYNLF
jgi:translation initiation factor 2 subunit 2